MVKNTEKIFLITPKIWVRAFDEEEARDLFFKKMILPNIPSGLCTDHETGNIEYVKDDDFAEVWNEKIKPELDRMMRERFGEGRKSRGKK